MKQLNLKAFNLMSLDGQLVYLYLIEQPNPFEVKVKEIREKMPVHDPVEAFFEIADSGVVF